MYKFHFSVTDHVNLINLLFAIFRMEELDRHVRSSVASALTRLLKYEGDGGGGGGGGGEVYI